MPGEKAAAQEAKAASKNEARVLLAANGVQTGLGGVFQSLGNAVAGATQLATGVNTATQTLQTYSPNATTQLLGGGVEDQNSLLMQQLAMQQAADEEKKKKTITWIIVGAVLAIVIVGVVLFLRNQKKAA